MLPRAWIALSLTAAGLAAGMAPAAAQAAGTCPWMDAAKPPAERAAQLLKAMSLDDKIALSFGSFSSYGFAAQTPANDALCIPAFVYSDGPAGIAGGFGGTQTGVTAFPTGIAQGASWDPALQRRFGQTIAQEALAKGANVLLGPAMNINRIPMNGRNFEYFGEDPFLSSRIAVAETRGVQTEPVVATIKHYAANNQETDRMTVSAEVDERTLREIYLPAFEAAVKEGHAGSVMCAYNRVNGAYACQNPELLTKILKSEWGFDGWVMSDWLATHTTQEAVLAGLDQEQNGTGQNYFGDKLKAAVQAGKVPPARIDDLALRILRPAFRIGLFDKRPAAQPGAFSANVSTPAHNRVAAEMAEQGAVLLKNAGATLPLDALGAGARIAVIGRPAAPAGATTAAVGSGSAHVNGQITDPLTAIESRAAAQQAVVTYAEGDAQADAVAAATAADIAVVFVRDAEGEGFDRPGLELNDGVCVLVACAPTGRDQNALIAAVAQANPNTIVVLVTGGPVSMPWLGAVKGVLEVWWPGSQYGNAVASLLFGDANPSGKLPQTFP
ncbi:MAG: bglX, partial [Solirubrobacterales bacterium]|nr:bglX [Solirubrobacterales bacterium]